MRKIISRMLVIGILLLLGFNIQVNAENLFRGPECAAYDSLRNRYLITNVGSAMIVEIDSTGAQSYWGEWVPSSMALGCVIKDGIFFYSGSNDKVIGLDLETGNKAWYVTVPGGDNFGVDGLATDTSGYIYVVGRISGTIQKIRISDSTSTEFLSTGLPQYPQELYFDARYNRLVVCSWAANAPLVGVDLVTAEITVIADDIVGWRDGITMDQFGNYYTASEVYGVVTVFDGEGIKPPVEIMGGLMGPSGLYYNWETNVLVIPVSDEDTVIFIEINTNDTDGDGYIDSFDNCVDIENYDQMNSFYKLTWGDNLHVGYWPSEDDHAPLDVVQIACVHQIFADASHEPSTLS